ncbi:uncharacterized protein LOC128746003 [Sabethes cyaneus]|uniref:uncharacterized protein LOC128746003 n=1 Tax=Sabethes cyaneus TaxID=53552 RepID=UPI00237DF5C9|nr:uncharacterized protein LOC128746003 [Sabethes cyaneus]
MAAFILKTSKCKISIHDLNRNPIAIIPLGDARISGSYLRIAHPIDLELLETNIKAIVKTAESKIKANQILSPLIQNKLQKLHTIVTKIKPNQRSRRWETLGKIWKYVSGSPDAEDLKIINATLNSLISQNDKQIKINNAVDTRISNITKNLHHLINYQQNITSETLEGFDSVNIIFNLDELIYQLEVIEEAITLSRKNIPSSRIINPDELSVAKQFLSLNGLGSNVVDTVLDIASVYVVYSKEMIIYTLKIPRIKTTPYKLHYLEPIISKDLKIQLEANYYLEGHISYTTKTPCPKIKDMYICASSKMEPTTMCVQQIMNKQTAFCPMEKTYGKNLVKRVDDANIVINNADMLLTSNCSSQERRLQGSFLIQFHNCTLVLNGDEYANNYVEIQPQPFVPTTGLRVNAIKIINRIPFELLQERHFLQQQRSPF